MKVTQKYRTDKKLIPVINEWQASSQTISCIKQLYKIRIYQIRELFHISSIYLNIIIIYQNIISTNKNKKVHK